MKKVLSSNSTRYKIIRTILEGVISVIVVNIDLIIGLAPWVPMELRPVVTAICMAILTPILAALGGDGEDPMELTDDEAEWLEGVDPESTSEIDGEAM